MKLKKTRTERGFGIVEFTDRYGEACSLQMSSLATEAAIWLGISEVKPTIMASDALRLGLPTGGQTVGWVPFEVPKEVLLSSRMHLTQEQVAALLPYLQQFVETGEI